jgi:RimJ/RimL family protein N-acetyltransferase
MNTILDTERLIIRKFDLSDAGFIIELLNSPGWLQFIGDRNVKTVADAEGYLLNGPLKSYEVNGFGLYGVTLKDGTPIGMCGLIKRDALQHVDVGFAFMPLHTGKGYALEATEAILSYARNELGFTTILAITTQDNVQSINLLKKIGLRFERLIQMPGDDEVLMLHTTAL